MWLDEKEYGDNGHTMPEGQDYAAFALQDERDIERSDMFVAFTEAPGGYPRGGRHVEFGIARANGLTLVAIGYLENAFHHLPGVLFFDDFEHFVRTYGHVMNLKTIGRENETQRS